ncbi:hypothetical protein [Bacillus sp. SH7-1]|nr:hypothetical protein [Bacillus sp. SH7-1]
MIRFTDNPFEVVRGKDVYPPYTSLTDMKTIPETFLLTIIWIKAF